MNEETIVAVYDSATQADAAVRDLIAADVPESAITRHDRIASGMEDAEAAPPREEGFWSRMFGGDRDYDHQVYDRSIESGSTVVSVRVDEAHVMRVSEILDRHHPIDIDERASGYGLVPAGYTETSYDAPLARSAETGIEDTATTPATETLRLAEERLTVGKRLVNRGGTRLRRYVVETPVEEQVTLHEERVTLDRRPVTGTVAADAGSFTDRTIEMAETREEAVVSKTAYVTEEVRLRREAVDRIETVRDTLRREEVAVESLPEEAVAIPRR